VSGIPRFFYLPLPFGNTPDLSTVVFMGPSLPLFSAFSAVLAGMGCTLCQSKKKYPEDCQSSRFEPNVFSFIGKWLSYLRFKIFTQKSQDLNPECKEGSISIMQLGVLTGNTER